VTGKFEPFSAGPKSFESITEGREGAKACYVSVSHCCVCVFGMCLQCQVGARRTALLFLFSLACLSVSECNAILAQLLHIDNVFAYYYFFAGCSDMQSDWRRKVEECTQVRKRVVAREFRAAKYTMRDEVAVAARRGAHTLSYFKRQKRKEKDSSAARVR